MPGAIIADTGYAVMTGVSAGECPNYTLEKVESDEALRVVRFTTPEGVWLFAANFGDKELLWEKRSIAPGACELIEL
jgi:hypothetical protein